MSVQPSDVALRALEPRDAADLLALRVRNRQHFAPAEPLHDDDWFTLERQAGELAAEAEARAAGRQLSFGVFLDDRLVGRMALTSIVRGAFLNAYLGYGIDHEHTGRGIATEAVGQVVAIAWDHGLHRVQAAVSLDNPGSRRVLEKVGFRCEGLALRYLRLGGRWTDQELWAITRDAPSDLSPGRSETARQRHGAGLRQTNAASRDR